MKKICFLAYFGLFYHIIRSKVSLTLPILSKWCITISYDKINCWIPLNCPNLVSKHTFFYEKTCFLAYFGLFYHMIRSKVRLTYIIPSKMPYLIESQYIQSIDFTLLPKFGLNTHIFYEEISFFQFFDLFGHIFLF